MLYQLSYFRISLSGGQRWIRTTEVERQQIYSLPHLATLEFARDVFAFDAYQQTKIASFVLSLLSDSNQRPRDYKSRALAN